MLCFARNDKAEVTQAEALRLPIFLGNGIGHGEMKEWETW
jgi:hypothetical protein